MKLLRALDSAATAFFNELWPIPEPLDDFDEAATGRYLACGGYDTDLHFGPLDTDCMTASTDGDARDAPRPPVEDAPRVAPIPSVGDAGRPHITQTSPDLSCPECGSPVVVGLEFFPPTH